MPISSVVPKDTRTLQKADNYRNKYVYYKP